MQYPIVLFDIDGTLVDSSGAGRRSLDRTFLDLYGIQDAFRGYDFVGKTDLGILRDAFNTHLDRDPTPDEIQQARDTYVALLRAELDKPDVVVRTMPGCRELLEALQDLPVQVGLATGNLKRGAALKLGAVDLYRFFPFGGFGSDAEDRTELTVIAADRGRAAAGEDVPGARILVVGDSPLDARAARGAGLHVLLVRTGWTPREDLQAEHPEHLLDDLSDTDRALAMITG